MTVNQKQLAQCLGLSSRRIRQLREEGLFLGDGTEKGYKLEKCMQEYIEYKINSETGRNESIKKEEMQAKHEEVKMQISLVKLRRLRRELHEAADVESFLSDMLVRFKNRLMAVPNKLAMQTVGENDINTVIDIMKKELSTVLEELSEYNPDEIDGEKMALESNEIDEEPDEGGEEE